MWFSVVYMFIALIIILCILSKKIREAVAIVVVASMLVACTLSLHGALAEVPTGEVEGVIIRVAPEYYEYPVLIVTVETFEGEIYTYYAEDEIDVQGVVTLVLFGDEVVDVR